jgi:hypothetical protein
MTFLDILLDATNSNSLELVALIMSRPRECHPWAFAE